MAEKTVFPGMPVGFPVKNAPVGGTPARGTVYPGMAPSASTGGVTEGKPLMGFLFSVSKTPYGEFWPLYAGPNTIGRNPGNTVQLHEATVSGTHATLVIRRMQQSGVSSGLSVFIQDTGSAVGTMLNGCTLDYNPRCCKTGDIITVGENYELYLVLVDADAIGLSVRDNFMPSEQEPVSMPAGMNPFEWGQAPASPFAGSEHKGTLPGSGFVSSALVGQSQPVASNPFDSRKATIYMPGKK